MADDCAWMFKPVDDLTREEAIAALKEMMKFAAELRQAMDDIPADVYGMLGIKRNG